MGGGGGTTQPAAVGPQQQQRRSRAGRVRTVLTEKQLTMMKSCFNANPRPDALMKEQIIEMTGLNSRVIRVWFQNKRCKEKKRNIREQSKVGIYALLLLVLSKSRNMCVFVCIGVGNRFR